MLKASNLIHMKPRKKPLKPKIAKPPPIGLPRDVARKLEYYFLAFETDAGLHSVWNSAIMAANGIKSAGSSGHDYALPGIGSKDFEEARIVHNRLREMCEAGLKNEVAVLYKFYGPQHVNARHGVWAEYAQLADMTKRVTDVKGGLIASRLAELWTHTVANLAKIGASDDAYERCGDSVLREARNVSESEAISWALSLNRSIAFKDKFVADVLKECKELLSKASEAYLKA